MDTQYRSRICSLVLVFIASGCASTIGNRVDLHDTSFTVGVTTKTEVANVLGYPEHRTAIEGEEYWGYPDRPELTGVIYAVPTSNNTVTTYHVSRLNTLPPSFERAKVVYVFDPSGTLANIHTTD